MAESGIIFRKKTIANKMALSLLFARTKAKADSAPNRTAMAVLPKADTKLFSRDFSTLM